MRKDENGNIAPETLGEYYDFCELLFGEDNKATKFIKNKIESQSSDEKVVACDSQMRSFLFSLAKEGK